MKGENQYVATTLAGLENVLAAELIELGADDVQAGIRAVYFSGDLKMLYRANYYLRTALRVLYPIKKFTLKSADDLYFTARSMAWDDFFNVNQTFAIHHTIFSDLFKNSMFASLKLKDAIADYFRDKCNRRPSVDPVAPDVYINVHIANGLCTISLDSSGESLHKRGYRVSQTAAPINEVLAAGLLKLSGWDGTRDFLDPMCGSGTIAIEAAMLARNIAPGTTRKNFAFQNWKVFRRDEYRTVTEEQKDRPLKCRIVAADILRANTDIAWKNAEKAGVSKDITLRTSDFKVLDAGLSQPFLLFNPPYGERLMPDDPNFYGMVGERLKHHYEGATAWIISTNSCLKNIGLKPSEKIALLNGSIECSFRRYDLFKGERKEHLPVKDQAN